MNKQDGKIKLSTALKQRYNAEQLSSRQLQALNKMQRGKDSEQRLIRSSDRTTDIGGGFTATKAGIRKRLRYLRWPLSAAALLLIAVLLAFPTYRHLNVTDRVVSEVAHNHRHGAVVEVQADSIPVLAKQLSRLEFPLIASAHMPKQDWQLIGGRYCLIDGRLAAQIKVRNRQNNQIYTYYQAQLPRDLEGLTMPINRLNEGVDVRLWKEQGLLLGLAGSGLTASLGDT